MAWQRYQNYGQRNYSEPGVQRYKQILGRAIHIREMSHQQQEFMIGCDMLNKMTGLGMPESSKIAWIRLFNVGQIVLQQSRLSVGIF